MVGSRIEQTDDVLVLVGQASASERLQVHEVCHHPRIRDGVWVELNPDEIFDLHEDFGDIQAVQAKIIESRIASKRAVSPSSFG
jgi:hypothetical protein